MVYKLKVERTDLNFSAAHFLIRHPKCERIHGHNYKVTIEIESDKLNSQQMIVDFLDVRNIARDICQKMDHHILIPTKEKEVEIKEMGEEIEVIANRRRYIFPKDDALLLPIEATTVEKISEYIYKQLKQSPLKNMKIRVSVEEAEGSIGTYTEE
ncbi:MAG: 6-pyruvoyl tetrahydropterin synthase family protein [Candidatus Freyarchaeota archaeon]|nr:6-pyruvoyl tetrahydropterin synthase family protein [Candidatus Jordarchaeia archaeon]MBS7278740.1 6-pyruvoyl tetrahydropterin synthase family protein [Candidatus Jordarchaeia archaeon]